MSRCIHAICTCIHISMLITYIFRSHHGSFVKGSLGATAGSANCHCYATRLPALPNKFWHVFTTLTREETKGPQPTGKTRTKPSWIWKDSDNVSGGRFLHPITKSTPTWLKKMTPVSCYNSQPQSKQIPQNKGTPLSKIYPVDPFTCKVGNQENHPLICKRKIAGYLV